MFWGRGKSLATTGIQTPDYPAHSLVGIPTMLCLLSFLEVINFYSFLPYLLCDKFIFSWYNLNASLSYVPNYTLIRQFLTCTESQFFIITSSVCYLLGVALCPQSDIKKSHFRNWF